MSGHWSQCWKRNRKEDSVLTFMELTFQWRGEAGSSKSRTWSISRWSHGENQAGGGDTEWWVGETYRVWFHLCRALKEVRWLGQPLSTGLGGGRGKWLGCLGCSSSGGGIRGRGQSHSCWGWRSSQGRSYRMWLCSSKTLWILKFEFHITFIHHEIILIFSSFVSTI